MQSMYALTAKVADPMEEAQRWFKAMVKHGFFSEHADGNSAHRFMYMGIDNNMVLFKERMTRAYLRIDVALLSC